MSHNSEPQDSDEDDYLEMEGGLPASPTVNSPGPPYSPGNIGRPIPPPKRNPKNKAAPPKPSETLPAPSAPPSAETISLRSLATTRLPQRIRLLSRPALNAPDGSSATLLAMGGVCDVHFEHCRRTVTAHSLSGSASFAIPLNSSIRFGLLYEPKETNSATDGALFATVSDILDAQPMPKVICAQKTYVGSSLNKMVSAGEVLAVLSVSSSDDGCRYLSVYSFLRKKEIGLPFFCAGNFTTSPSKVQLHLRDIVACVKDPFPSKAWPFAESQEVSKCFSTGFFNNAVALLDLGETLTVIVTPVLASDSPGKGRGKEVELVAEENILATILPLSADAMATFRTQTNALKKNYDERKIGYVLQAREKEKDRDQEQLFRHVLSAHVTQEEPPKATLMTLQTKYEALADDVRSIR